MAEKKIIELEVRNDIPNLRSELRRAQQDVVALSEKFGATSEQAIAAAKRASELKDAIGDAKALTDAFNPDAKFNALSSSIGGVLNGFQAYEGALGVIGVESEALQETLLKVQSAMALSQGVQGLMEARDSFKQLGAVIQDTFKGLKGALLASGIGAFVVLLGTVVAYWDDIKEAIFETNKAQDTFNDTLEDFNKGAQEAIVKTQQVESAFKLARKGVISKEEALQTYNDTLGDSFGKATSLNEAEELFAKKSAAYIRATALRAQANAILAKSAEVMANAVTGSFEDQTTLADKWAIGLKSAFGSTEEVFEETKKRQKQRVKENLQEANVQKKSLEDLAQTLLQQAEETENANGIISESEKKLNDERQKRYEEEKARLEELRKQRKQDLLDIENEQIAKEQEIAEKRLQRELELGEAINEANKKQSQQTLTELEKEEQAIRESYLRKLDLAEEFGYGQQELTEQMLNEINDVRLKYAEQEIALEQEKKSKLDAINEDAKNKELERIEALNQARINGVKNGLQLASDLVSLFSAKSEKEARRQFQIQKALSIAQATVNTFEAVQSAYASALKSPIFAVNPAYPFIQAAAAGAFGAVQIAKIAKTKYQSSGTQSVDTSPSGGGGGQQGAITPNFNVVGNSGVNQLATLQQQPIQAYVVSGQVTSAQALDRNRIQNATL
jgi:hypothetical protein